MSQINGTSVLVYVDGTLLATQTDCTITVDQELLPTTNKSSGGWASHINGTKSGSVSCGALWSTTGLSSDSLIASLIAGSSVLLMMDISNVTMVGIADISSTSIEAPTEGVATISVEFQCTGGLYILTGDSVQLLTGWTNGTYDTFSTTGTTITSAIQDSGASYAVSNGIDITDEDVVKILTYVTYTSGEYPTFTLKASAGGAAVSNAVQTGNGASLMTLTATATDSTSVLEITNTGATSFAIGLTYVFKV